MDIISIGKSYRSPTGTLEDIIKYIFLISTDNSSKISFDYFSLRISLIFQFFLVVQEAMSMFSTLYSSRSRSRIMSLKKKISLSSQMSKTVAEFLQYTKGILDDIGELVTTKKCSNRTRRVPSWHKDYD